MEVLSTCTMFKVISLLIFCPYPVYSASIEKVDQPEGCTTYDTLPGVADPGGLGYSCYLTATNLNDVLHAIKQPRIHMLVVFSLSLANLVFGDNSFSPDLEALSLISHFPFYMTSAALNGSSHLSMLNVSQFIEIDKREAEDLLKPAILEGDPSLTSSTFGRGWLLPVPGLKKLGLRHTNTSGFHLGEFCILKNLTWLDLSVNRITRVEELGITCNSTEATCLPCLPQVTYLNISHNPITEFNINITDALPQLKYLDICCGNISFLNLSHILSRTTENLNISNNHLSSLVMDVCTNSSLHVLDLQQNRLKYISQGLLSCMQRLQWLDLSNNILNQETLIKAGLNDLTELKALDMSFNKITALLPSLIGNLTELQWLGCTGCGLLDIEPYTFFYLRKLELVKLDRNHLQTLEPRAFVSVHNLQILNLSHNRFTSTNFMKNLSSLRELHLGYNQLHKIPEFQDLWTKLTVLELQGNNITDIDYQPFKNCSRVRQLSLNFNSIKVIPDNAFKGLHNLRELRLDGNRIRTIEYFGLDGIPELLHIRLDNNLLSEFPVVKGSKLQGLNLSRNFIKALDTKYYVIKWIDLSYNHIYEIKTQLSLLTKLQILNLTYNLLTSLDMDTFLTATIPRPRVSLQGNPLHCDCHMGWLLDTKLQKMALTQRISTSVSNRIGENKHWIRDIRHINYAEIVDLDLLQCSSSDTGEILSFSMITPQAFLCSYTHLCNPSLDCPDKCCNKSHFLDCSCTRPCYAECACYYNLPDATTDFMNCTLRNMTQLPRQGPTWTRSITLDGNNLSNLKSSSLNFPYLEQLYINKSNIFHIHPDALGRLINLRLLDAHQNHITGITGGMFRQLNFLRELYLHENNIHYIEVTGLKGLSNLQKLWLHGNMLGHLNFSIMDEMGGLKELTLHENPWSCDCEFGPIFKHWLVAHADIVKNHTQIFCIQQTNNSNQHNILNDSDKYHGLMGRMNKPVVLVDFSLWCNKTILTNVEYKHVKSTKEIIFLVALFLAFVITVVVIYKHRVLLRVWSYNRWGVRFRREERDDDDKPYDVFIAYAKADERIVQKKLLAELEQEQMSYKVCLECRNWPPGAATTDTIITSVQQSKRTIVLVSPAHLDSQWCEYSFDAAHYQVMSDKQMRLLLVLTDRHLECRMTKAMKLYMATNAFLVIGEKWFGEKLRYHLADNPRGSEQEDDFRLLQVY